MAEKQNISDSLLVKTMLSYGTLDDFHDLMITLSPNTRYRGVLLCN